VACDLWRWLEEAAFCRMNLNYLASSIGSLLACGTFDVPLDFAENNAKAIAPEPEKKSA
jgi:hypothetical protein